MFAFLGMHCPTLLSNLTCLPTASLNVTYKALTKHSLGGPVKYVYIVYNILLL